MDNTKDAEKMRQAKSAKKPNKTGTHRNKGKCRRPRNGAFSQGCTLLTEKDNDAIIAGFRLMKYLSEIADSLQVSRQTLALWISKHPELQEAQQEAEERRLDAGEAALMYLVKKKSPKAIMFQLERKGRARGYGATAMPIAAIVPQIVDDVPDAEI